MENTGKSLIRVGWGTRVFLLYTGFVAMIVFFVIRSMGQKVDLVSKDYYEQEIKYQDKLDRKARANALATPLTWDMVNGDVKVIFPAEFKGKEIKGEITFFRPSDSARDKHIPIKADANCEQVISRNELVNGLYRLQIDWTVDGISYYKEGTVMMN